MRSSTARSLRQLLCNVLSHRWQQDLHGTFHCLGSLQTTNSLIETPRGRLNIQLFGSHAQAKSKESIPTFHLSGRVSSFLRTGLESRPNGPRVMGLGLHQVEESLRHPWASQTQAHGGEGQTTQCLLAEVGEEALLETTEITDG